MGQINLSTEEINDRLKRSTKFVNSVEELDSIDTDSFDGIVHDRSTGNNFYLDDGEWKQSGASQILRAGLISGTLYVSEVKIG